MRFFSFRRLWAIISKEFIQMKRDKATFAMMVGVPLMQLILFGFAINSDPKQLPTAVLAADSSAFTRTLLKAMENTQYFKFVTPPKSEQQAIRWLKQGKVQFILSIPPNFTRDLIRHEHPTLLIEADATDPSATSNAISSIEMLAKQALDLQLNGPLALLKASPTPFKLAVHANYNPLRITQYNIVPGLLGVVLTMTMVMITALSMTREAERGTMENLLAMPTRPLEVMLGKILPYVLVGFIQVSIILSVGKLLFDLPTQGSLTLLLLLCLPFIGANLAVGLTFSTIAKNQLQAMQATFFFFLPSILLSGFMFPFKGMPDWAQSLGNLLPLTHFLRIVRGILLKGNDFSLLLPEIMPIVVFTLLVLGIGLSRYRQTLD